jgi:hypothetical protein
MVAPAARLTPLTVIVEPWTATVPVLAVVYPGAEGVPDGGVHPLGTSTVTDPPLIARPAVYVKLSVVCSPTATEAGDADMLVTAGAAGVTAFDGVEAGPAPAALLATTVNVYVVPFVRPATTAEVPVVAVPV